MRRLALICLLVAVAMAGCGGDDKKDAEQTVRDFVDALNTHDADRYCDELITKEFLEKTVWGDFGSGIDDRDYMVAAFERHTAEVRRAIPKDRLLVLEVAQGWKPLCEFLDVPVPNVPFPRLNSREEMAAMLAAAGAGPAAAPEDIAAHAKEFIAQSRKLCLAAG